MSYIILYSNNALLDIENIYKYIKSESGNEQITRNFIINIKIKINSICAFPYSHKQAELLTNDFTVRIMSYKKYYIVYKIDSSKKIIVILNIFNMKKPLSLVKIEA